MTTPQEARAVAQWLRADFEGNAIDEAAHMLTEYADLLERAEHLMQALQEADTIMSHDDAATEWREKWAGLWPNVRGNRPWPHRSNE